MTGHEYQVLCLRTAGAIQPEDLVVNGVMGLNGEAGECIDIVKKHMFQKHALDAQHLKEELGDVSWYLAITAAGLGVDLDKIFEDNIAKLKARYPEGFDADRSINRA